MRKAIGLILAFGMVGVLLTVISLMMGMGTLADSTVGERARLAISIAKEFKLAKVTSDSPATQFDLLYTIHVTIPKGAPKPPAADEDEARRTCALAKVDLNLRQVKEAETKLDDVRQRYPDTVAAIDARLVQVAIYIQRNYVATDRSKISKITVKQKTIRGTIAALNDEQVFTMDMGIPKETETHK